MNHNYGKLIFPALKLLGFIFLLTNPVSLEAKMKNSVLHFKLQGGEPPPYVLTLTVYDNGEAITTEPDKRPTYKGMLKQEEISDIVRIISELKDFDIKSLGHVYDDDEDVFNLEIRTNGEKLSFSTIPARPITPFSPVLGEINKIISFIVSHGQAVTETLPSKSENPSKPVLTLSCRETKKATKKSPPEIKIYLKNESSDKVSVILPTSHMNSHIYIRIINPKGEIAYFQNSWGQHHPRKGGPQPEREYPIWLSPHEQKMIAYSWTEESLPPFTNFQIMPGLSFIPAGIESRHVPHLRENYPNRGKYRMEVLYVNNVAFEGNLDDLFKKPDQQDIKKGIFEGILRVSCDISF